jgi:hypothetical protein
MRSRRASRPARARRPFCNLIARIVPAPMNSIDGCGWSLPKAVTADAVRCFSNNTSRGSQDQIRSPRPLKCERAAPRSPCRVVARVEPLLRHDADARWFTADHRDLGRHRRRPRDCQHGAVTPKDAEYRARPSRIRCRLRCGQPFLLCQRSRTRHAHHDRGRRGAHRSSLPAIHRRSLRVVRRARSGPSDPDHHRGHDPRRPVVGGPKPPVLGSD